MEKQQKVSRLMIALMAFGFASSAMAQTAPAPEVSVQTELGATPVAEGTVSTTTADVGTPDVRVDLLPPAGGNLTITYAPPDVRWSANRDGSWSGWLPAVNDSEGHTVLVDIASPTGGGTGLIRLDTGATEAGTTLVITVAPQSGWIGDMIDSILTSDFCEAYLTDFQFPSHAPSKTVWQYCVDKLGL